jgi:hypothetical protein
MLLRYLSWTEIHGDWAVDAAGLLPDARFLPALDGRLVRLEGQDVVYFRGSVESTIVASVGRRAHENTSLQ